ncbi:hypothetical protein GCK32_018771 [Trichostrongylus colubriformis]|uniref:DNA polymerase epsilon subunit 3 n=1 Tax=Trichostrongylus colubriformis TaxID=6319 RepID=A0AAN8IF98_TRICO
MSDPKTEDLRLPMAVLNRIMKSVLPGGAALSKDARTHMMRACSVFILYILSQAEEHAASKKRKTVNVEDVMFVLKAGEFDTIHDAMSTAFEAYKASRPAKPLKTKGLRLDERPGAPNPIERIKDINFVERGTDEEDIEDIINN